MVGLSETIAFIVATCLGGFLSALAHTTMRKALIVLGFPLSMAASSATLSVPPIGWLFLLGLIVLVYPRKAWRDAPLFPTPKRALREMQQHITLPAGARILDAGSGLGDGLLALRDAFPRAELHGVDENARPQSLQQASGLTDFDSGFLRHYLSFLVVFGGVTPPQGCQI